MNIRSLYYFKTVVEYASYTKASKILHISQPSLSASIKKLEREVGLPLFYRTGNDIRLTQAGGAVYEEAVKLVHHYEHVTDEIVRLKNEGPKEISIGIIESSKDWIAHILRSFKSSHSDVHVKLIDLLTRHAVKESLNNFSVNFAITNQYVDDIYTNVIPLYEEKLVALLPWNHHLQEKEILEVEEIEQEDFILCASGYQTREDILNTFRKKGRKPNISFEIERFETACSLVRSNLGITILPEHYVNALEPSAFHIRPLNSSELKRTVYIAYSKNTYLSPMVENIIDLSIDYFKKL